MTLDDPVYDKAVRKAMKRFELAEDPTVSDEDTYYLSNDYCLLDIWHLGGGVYALNAVLADNKIIKDTGHVDPYRFYKAMVKKIPFFSIKFEENSITYGILNDSPDDIMADVGECILVSKMFSATFDEVLSEMLSGKRR